MVKIVEASAFLLPVIWLLLLQSPTLKKIDFPADAIAAFIAAVVVDIVAFCAMMAVWILIK